MGEDLVLIGLLCLCLACAFQLLLSMALMRAIRVLEKRIDDLEDTHEATQDSD